MVFKIVLFVAVIAASQAGYLEPYNYNFGGYHALPYSYGYERSLLSSPLPYHTGYTGYAAAPLIQSYAQPAPIVRTVVQPQPIVRSYVEPTPVVTKVSQVPIVAPVTKTIVKPAIAEYDFGHTVSDPYTANHQTRRESRRGDVVTGSYSLLDADGTKRIVDYSASPLTGFKAVVRKEPGVVAATPVLKALA